MAQMFKRPQNQPVWPVKHIFNQDKFASSAAYSLYLQPQSVGMKITPTISFLNDIFLELPKKIHKVKEQPLS